MWASIVGPVAVSSRGRQRSLAVSSENQTEYNGKCTFSTASFMASFCYRKYIFKYMSAFTEMLLKFYVFRKQHREWFLKDLLLRKCKILVILLFKLNYVYV